MIKRACKHIRTRKHTRTRKYTRTRKHAQTVWRAATPTPIAVSLSLLERSHWICVRIVQCAMCNVFDAGAVLVRVNDQWVCDTTMRQAVASLQRKDGCVCMCVRMDAGAWVCMWVCMYKHGYDVGVLKSRDQIWIWISPHTQAHSPSLQSLWSSHVRWCQLYRHRHSQHKRQQLHVHRIRACRYRWHWQIVCQYAR
jgi:hypothetical protein